MSRKLLAFWLHELKIVRIKCNKCKTIIEIPISQLDKTMGRAVCKFCGDHNTNEPRTDQHFNPFHQLAEAISEMQKIREFDVEFVLEEKPEASSDAAK